VCVIHLGKGIWRGTFHIYFKKWFLAIKTLLSPLDIGKKNFLSTLNIMILQMVRNEYVRFGGHVDIEFSYKILWLEILKETPSLHNLPCFEGECMVGWLTFCVTMQFSGGTLCCKSKEK
jgi:hypothetical protein